MATASETTQNRRVLAVSICLLLLFIYKFQVWDPYFNGRGPAESGSAATGDHAPSPADRSPAVEQAQSPTSPIERDLPFTKPNGPQVPTDAQITNAGTIEIETEQVKATISLLGGRITELLLKDFAATVEPGSPRLNLVDHAEGAAYPLGVYSGTVNDSWVNYSVLEAPPAEGKGRYRLAAGSPAAFTLEGALGDGRTIRKVVTFNPQGYFIQVDVRLSAPPENQGALELEWTKLIAPNSPTLLDPYNVSGVVWFDGQKAQREKYAKIDAQQSRQELGRVAWISQAEKYFMATLLAAQGTAPGRVEKNGQLYSSRLASPKTEESFLVYAGPKSYRNLKSLGYALERNIDFGATGFVAAPLLSLLYLFHDLLGNYGLAIVLLTIMVRASLYPLNATSFRQMKAMQAIAPDVKRIRDTVKDKQQQQLELMALYKKRGVNPVGGCFPVLIQMPVFLGLYSSLMLSIELRHAPFALWIKDLSAPEQLHVGGVTIPVMVIMFVVSMLIQQWVTPSQMDPVQKKVMMVMPIVFGFMFSKMPAGLTLYWLTNNLIAIAQQQGMNARGTRAAFGITAAASLSWFLLAWILVHLTR